MTKTVGADPYAVVLDRLEVFYGGIANRLSFRKALEDLLTPTECRCWLLFPDHTESPVTADEVKANCAPSDLESFAGTVQHLEETFFLAPYGERAGVKMYVRNYLFQLVIAYAGVSDGSPMAIACRDWFNGVREGGSGGFPFEYPEYRVIPHEGVLTGDQEFGHIPLDLQIPDEREVVPYDYVSHMIEGRRKMIVVDCFCRSNKEAMGIRTCKHDLNTCILFDDLAEKTLQIGVGREIDQTEARAIARKARDSGLVTSISNAKEPAVLCACCKCCCLPLASLSRGETTVSKASRWEAAHEVDSCVMCGECGEVCPAGAIDVGETYDLNLDKCLGCGLCVSACPTGSLILALRGDAQKYLPDQEKLDLLFI